MSRSVFIVDDDAGHAALIATILKDSGFKETIRFFENSYEVLDTLFPPEGSSQLPTLLFLDLNMPGMHGTELLRRLKSDRLTSILPVIVVSTSCNQVEINKCYSLGCNLYITKPPRFADFESAIRLTGRLMEVANFPACA